MRRPSPRRRRWRSPGSRAWRRRTSPAKSSRTCRGSRQSGKQREGADVREPSFHARCVFGLRGCHAAEPCRRQAIGGPTRCLGIAAGGGDCSHGDRSRGTCADTERTFVGLAGGGRTRSRGSNRSTAACPCQRFFGLEPRVVRDLGASDVGRALAAASRPRCLPPREAGHRAGRRAGGPVGAPLRRRPGRRAAPRCRVGLRTRRAPSPCLHPVGRFDDRSPSSMAEVRAIRQSRPPDSRDYFAPRPPPKLTSLKPAALQASLVLETSS